MFSFWKLSHAWYGIDAEMMDKLTYKKSLEPEFVNDSVAQESIPPVYVAWWAEPVFVNLFKEPRNRFPAWRAAGTAILFVVPACHARLHRLAESVPWNPFLGSLKVYKFGLSCVVLCIAPVKHLIPLQRTYQCINIRIFTVFSVCYMPKFAFRQCFDTMQIFSLFLCLLFLLHKQYYYFSIQKPAQKEKKLFYREKLFTSSQTLSG
jgi:hypothetical protein